MAQDTAAACEWLRTGEEVFPAMLDAIATARESVRLETYIFRADPLGIEFRELLVRVARNGVHVAVLIDALGSNELPASFWEPLLAAGGLVRWFNPLSLNRFSIRDHRKLLVCDDNAAFVGGYNIAQEYAGDGVERGWRDLGLKLTGPLARQLSAAFDEMFERADFQHLRFTRLRKTRAKKIVAARSGELLLSGPGRGRNPLKRALHRDLSRARSVRITAAYFLPTWRLRRQLMRIARRGGAVQLILAGKTDVALSQLATRSLYRRLLRAGVEIHEYEPQILHSKLMIVDNAVYVGSSNLDTRSLSINYELQVRLHDASVAAEARQIFADTLKHCRQVTREEWRRSRNWWNRLRERWAYFLLVHVDTWIARRQLRRLRH